MIIFDLDGTLALIEHRRHFVTKPSHDWPSFFKACVDDDPNLPVIACLSALYKDEHHIQIWSGRSDEVRAETVAWLLDHICNTDYLPWELRMRPAGNYEPDEVIKEHWLDEYLATGGIVEMVFEDRTRMVAMWRRRGIPCFQVAPGDF